MNTTSTMTDQAKDRADELKRDISTGFERGKNNFSEMTGRVFDRSKGWARSTDEYVHENTWTVLGVTLAVGIILGLAVTRR